MYYIDYEDMTILYSFTTVLFSCDLQTKKHSNIFITMAKSDNLHKNIKIYILPLSEKVGGGGDKEFQTDNNARLPHTALMRPMSEGGGRLPGLCTFYVPLAYILHLLESCRFSKRICFPGQF